MAENLLYLTHRVPYPPDRGDRIRTWNILKALSACGTVDLVCLSDEPVTSETESALRSVTRRTAVIQHEGPLRWLRGACAFMAGRSISEGLFRSLALERVLQQWSRDTAYTGVLGSSSVMGQFLCETFGHSVRRWVDLIDVDSQKWLDYATASCGPKRWLYQTEARRLRRVECRLAEACRRLLLVSPNEVELMRTFCATGRIDAVSNGVDLDYFQPGPKTSDGKFRVVFVGVMNYRPNADAVIWFTENVWPAFLRKHPGSEFTIVGKSPAAEVRSLGEHPGVRVTGSVPDVRPYLHAADVSVAPLRIARGVQNKILEAMACGLPVVSASAPLNGLAARPGLHLMQADTAEDWIGALNRLADDECLRQETGLAAEAYVQTHHSWQSCLSSLSELAETAADNARFRREVQS